MDIANELDDQSDIIGDCGADEDEILRDFDAEAHLIIGKDTLPKKSACRYQLVYDTFMDWKKKNKADPLSESVLIVYFKELQQKLSPSTLWSIWSMLKKTLNTNDKTDINKYLNLKGFLKVNSKGYVPKKSLILKWIDIRQFVENAPDDIYLASKVINLSIQMITSTLIVFILMLNLQI